MKKLFTFNGGIDNTDIILESEITTTVAKAVGVTMNGKKMQIPYAGRCTNGYSSTFIDYGVYASYNVYAANDHIYANELVANASLGGYLAKYNTNENNGMFVYNASNPIQTVWANATTASTQAPVFSFLNGEITPYTGATLQAASVIEYKNRMMLANVEIMTSLAAGVTTESFKRSIFPSQGYDPFQYDYNNEILLDTTAPVAAQVSFKDFLFVFTLDKIFYFGVDSTGNYTPVQELSGYGGASAPKRVLATQTDLYWVNTGGIYRFNGAESVKISDKLGNKLNDFGNHIFTSTRNATLSFNTFNNVLYIGYGTDYTLCYDTINNIFVELDKYIISVKDAGPYGEYKTPVTKSGGSIVQSNTTDKYSETYSTESSEDPEIIKLLPLTIGADKEAKDVVLNLTLDVNGVSTAETLDVKAFWVGTDIKDLDANEELYVLNETISIIPRIHVSGQEFIYNISIPRNYKLSVPGHGKTLAVVFTKTVPANAYALDLIALEAEYDIISEY